MTSDQLKVSQDAPEVKKVKSNPKNLHISRDEFIANRRQEKELEARLDIAKGKIEKDLKAEDAARRKAAAAKAKADAKRAPAEEAEEVPVDEAQEEQQ